MRSEVIDAGSRRRAPERVVHLCVPRSFAPVGVCDLTVALDDPLEPIEVDPLLVRGAEVEGVNALIAWPSSAALDAR
jgi:hypothetical protein